MAVTTMIGAKIHRREDPRLVSGEGHFVDDFTRPGTAYMAVVRSPHAHARIKSIDLTAASKAPGVVAVYTHKDFAQVIAGVMATAPFFVPEKKQVPPRFPIADTEVVFQGEAVAVVLADTKYEAADGASLVDVDYDVLPAVTDLEKALKANSPTAHSGAPDNVGWEQTFIPDDPAVMKEADVVVKQRIVQQRLAPTSMETRGVLAEYSKADGTMTIWMSSQNPHLIRLLLVAGLGFAESKLRIISPDVGGGFGSKISPYPEDYLVPAAAKLSGRPVKWIETRTESLQITSHGRGEIFDVEAGAKKDGTLVYLKITQFIDVGAYMPLTSSVQAKAMEIAGYEKLRREQDEARKKGRYMGIGISSWIEICGFGPSAGTAPGTGGLGLVDAAQVRVFPTGSVAVYVGKHSHGQGHDTTFSQIAADTLGVPYDSIELRHGDTGEGPAFGHGTYGSRSLAVGGMAVHKACMKVVDKASKLAAHMFEADEADVVFDHGQFYVKGSPDKRKALGEVAFAAYGGSLPASIEHGLEAVAYFDPVNFSWPFGTHIAVVEIDPETGDADLKRYVAVDDCGNVINPMIVDGQVQGGIAQGIAQALYEEVVYDDESGQMKTGTLTDYLVPTANEFPMFELDRTVTPTLDN